MQAQSEGAVFVHLIDMHDHPMRINDWDRSDRIRPWWVHEMACGTNGRRLKQLAQNWSLFLVLAILSN
jgi:hypothetical protein